jgi:hypothetical protein
MHLDSLNIGEWWLPTLAIFADCSVLAGKLLLAEVRRSGNPPY